MGLAGLFALVPLVVFGLVPVFIRYGGEAIRRHDGRGLPDDAATADPTPGRRPVVSTTTFSYTHRVGAAISA